MAAFETEVEVRFGDCDPAGIVYYPTLFHYCHVAFEETWRHVVGVPYARLVADDRIGYPTVRVESDFQSPARYGDVVTFRVSVETIGRSSVRFVFDARIGDRLVLRSTDTKVCIDLDSRVAVPIPQQHRDALARLSE